jgi:hypothetical protein
MSKATKKQDLVWRGIDVINRIVLELQGQDGRDAVQQLREHLEARAYQIRPEEENSWE